MRGILAIALSLARMFRTVFFGLEPLDVRSMTVGAAILLLVAVAAAVAPARRASRVDPSVALRVDRLPVPP